MAAIVAVLFLPQYKPELAFSLFATLSFWPLVLALCLTVSRGPQLLLKEDEKQPQGNVRRETAWLCCYRKRRDLAGLFML